MNLPRFNIGDEEDDEHFIVTDEDERDRELEMGDFKGDVEREDEI